MSARIKERARRIEETLNFARRLWKTEYILALRQNPNRDPSEIWLEIDHFIKRCSYSNTSIMVRETIVKDYFNGLLGCGNFEISLSDSTKFRPSEWQELAKQVETDHDIKTQLREPIETKTKAKKK